MKPTRYYSARQEKKVAKKLGGKVQVNSGATMFRKGDVVMDNWLIECKTSTFPKRSYAIMKDELEKLDEERFAMKKEFSALAFDFGSDKTYYVIPENTFKLLIEKMKDEV